MTVRSNPFRWLVLAYLLLTVGASLGQPVGSTLTEGESLRLRSVATSLAVDIFKGRVAQAKMAFAPDARIRLGVSIEKAVLDLDDIGEFRTVGPPILQEFAFTEQTFAASCSRSQRRGSPETALRVVRTLNDNTGLNDVTDTAADHIYNWACNATTVKILTISLDDNEYLERSPESLRREMRGMSLAHAKVVTFQSGFRFSSRLPRPEYLKIFGEDRRTERCDIFVIAGTRNVRHTIVTVPGSFERGEFAIDVEFDEFGALIALYIDRAAIRAAATKWDREKYSQTDAREEQKALRASFAAMSAEIDAGFKELPRIRTIYGDGIVEDAALLYLTRIHSKCEVLATTTPPGTNVYLQMELARVVTKPVVTTTHLAADPTQRVSVADERSVRGIVGNLLRPFRNLLAQSDLSPDILFDSDQKNARIVIRAGSDPKSRRVVYTTNELPNVWRGIYSCTITLAGFKDSMFELNLVDEPRTTVKCSLARLDDEGLTFCQFVAPVTER